jgi:hypothetical protein
VFRRYYLGISNDRIKSITQIGKPVTAAPQATVNATNTASASAAPVLNQAAQPAVKSKRPRRSTAAEIQNKVAKSDTLILRALTVLNRPANKDNILEVLDQIEPRKTSNDKPNPWMGNASIDKSLTPDGHLWITNKIVAIPEITQTRSNSEAQSFILGSQATPEQLAFSINLRNERLTHLIKKIEVQFNERIATLKELQTLTK